jgi:nucleoid DNA-binding protein
MKKKFNKTHFKSFDINDLNSNLPISLRELQTVIEDISKRYPALKKHEVAVIIKIFMEEIRSQLIEGNEINIREFLFNMRLYTFAKLRKNKITLNTKVQVSTPKKLRIKNVNT